ncbi:adenylosuccinate synthetase [Patescibacteria group bacterium]|nr:adenylosuccinate synthetase [Patescibacteria group bacterium]
MAGCVDVALGAQWGDEGKGKTIVLHIIPSGIMWPDKICVIGNGVVVNPITLLKEIADLESLGISVAGRLFISKQAHMICPWLISLEKSRDNFIGTTNKAIGPTYESKMARKGVRFDSMMGFYGKFLEDLCKHANYTNRELTLNGQPIDTEVEVDEFAKNVFNSIVPFVADTVALLHKKYTESKSILIEGAQGAMLDIDFGTYPFVTSSNCTIGGCLTGTGLPARYVKDVVMISKCYTTRVGNGPFPTELFNDEAEKLRRLGNEFGATTGRPRRPGWLDLFQLKYSKMINGANFLTLVKADILSGYKTIKVCTGYLGLDNYPTDLLTLSSVMPVYHELPGWSSIYQNGELHQNLKDYIFFIEEYLNVPVLLLSIGPDREHTIFLK